MIIRTLKLKLSASQEATLNSWLWNLTGVWNWAIRKIELDANDKIYYSKFDFQNLLEGHSKKLKIPSHVLQGILNRAYISWSRCFKKIAQKPRLKGYRNKLNSIPFPDPIQFPENKRIKIPGLGNIKFHNQHIPNVKIKTGCIVKRASGWYLYLWLDTDHKFSVKETTKVIGIDPGFKTLLTLSDGIKIKNPRELHNGAERLAQAQRGHDKQLAARLQERQANRRKDRNHKISRWLVENYKIIYYSDDHFSSLAKQRGKSISEASLGSLIGMLNYKSRTGGRKIIPVESSFTTMTCGNCGARTGPAGFRGLEVRFWKCSACGVVHDRDVNSAQVVLKTGLGTSHEKRENVVQNLHEDIILPDERSKTKSGALRMVRIAKKI